MCAGSNWSQSHGVITLSTIVTNARLLGGCCPLAVSRDNMTIMPQCKKHPSTQCSSPVPQVANQREKNNNSLFENMLSKCFKYMEPVSFPYTLLLLCAIITICCATVLNFSC